VTVVSHFLGGSAPDWLPEVVSPGGAGRGAGWGGDCGRPSCEREKRKGRSPLRNLAPSDRISEDLASATRSQPCSPGVCSALAGLTRGTERSCDPQALQELLAAIGDFQFPGSSMSLVADTREGSRPALIREDCSSFADDYGTRKYRLPVIICVQINVRLWKWSNVNSVMQGIGNRMQLRRRTRGSGGTPGYRPGLVSAFKPVRGVLFNCDSDQLAARAHACLLKKFLNYRF